MKKIYFLLKGNVKIFLFLGLQILLTRSLICQSVVINEVLSSNISGIRDVFEPNYTNCPVPDCEYWYDQLGDLTIDGDYPDWIELYNQGSSTINLEGYGLSDSRSNLLKWVFPNIELTS